MPALSDRYEPDPLPQARSEIESAGQFGLPKKTSYIYIIMYIIIRVVEDFLPSRLGIPRNPILCMDLRQENIKPSLQSYLPALSAKF